MHFAQELTYRLVAGIFCLALHSSCNNDTAPPIDPQPETEVIDTAFYKVQVDNLRMREAPNLEAKTLTLLSQGVIVRTWGERSLRQDEIQLRGELRRDYWYRAKYQSYNGWIFGGALDKISDNPEDNFLIIPGRQFGPVLGTDSEADIINRLGKENVSHKEVSIGEGETVTGTVIFAGTDKELVLLWKEENFMALHEVRTSKPEAPWSTDLGVKIGSSLKQVERINGKSFRLSGFQWDYAGTTTGWNQGSIAESLVLVFAEPANHHSDLNGDQIIDSANARMQRANPKVSTLRVIF